MTPPSSDEAYENKLISLAMGEAQKLMESGEAPPGVILHFVRLGSERSKLEMEKLKAENEMLRAKAKALLKEKGLSYEEIVLGRDASTVAVRAISGRTTGPPGALGGSGSPPRGSWVSGVGAGGWWGGQAGAGGYAQGGQDVLRWPRAGRDDLRLRVAVQPGGCSGLVYQLYFDERVLDGDAVRNFDGVEVIVDKMSAPNLARTPPTTQAGNTNRHAMNVFP